LTELNLGILGENASR